MMLKHLYVILLFFLSYANIRQKIEKVVPAYEILSQVGDSIHYFVYIPRADTNGRLIDTLIILPSDTFRYF
jgi:hypothetical protein